MSSQNQNHPVDLAPEVVRMAQIRANRHGVSFRQELARLVAEEAVMSLDHELGLMIDGETMNQSDVLAAALGVNDLMVNGHRIDIRAIDEDGEVVIARALIGSQYLSGGTLVVRLRGIEGGAVVGYMPAGAWLAAEDGLRDADPIRVAYSEQPFDLAATVSQIVQKPVLNLPSAAKLNDLKSDLSDLFNDKGRLIVARQKQIFSYLCGYWCANLPEAMATVEAVGYKLPPSRVTKVLHSAGRWNAVVEKVAQSLSPRFSRVGIDEIRAQVMAHGERFGSEVKAPAFRKSLLTNLAACEMAASGKLSASAAQSVIARVLSGTAAVDAVKALVKNTVAVDLAVAIKAKRQAAIGFMAATADEIGMAFQQMALQPAYATHSAGDSGVDSINEALALLEATDMAETIKACDLEMSQL
jgi:hypothetical protein